MEISVGQLPDSTNWHNRGVSLGRIPGFHRGTPESKGILREAQGTREIWACMHTFSVISYCANLSDSLLYLLWSCVSTIMVTLIWKWVSVAVIFLYKYFLLSTLLFKIQLNQLSSWFCKTLNVLLRCYESVAAPKSIEEAAWSTVYRPSFSPSLFHFSHFHFDRAPNVSLHVTQVSSFFINAEMWNCVNVLYFFPSLHLTSRRNIRL